MDDTIFSHNYIVFGCTLLHCTILVTLNCTSFHFAVFVALDCVFIALQCVYFMCFTALQCTSCVCGGAVDFISLFHIQCCMYLSIVWWDGWSSRLEVASGIKAGLLFFSLKNHSPRSPSFSWSSTFSLIFLKMPSVVISMIHEKEIDSEVVLLTVL